MNSNANVRREEKSLSMQNSTLDPFTNTGIKNGEWGIDLKLIQCLKMNIKLYVNDRREDLPLFGEINLNSKSGAGKM